MPARGWSCLIKGCLGTTIVAIICIAVLAWLFLDSQSPINRRSAIACTCEWAQLEPLPVPNGEVKIETKGGMFSREFVITFTAPPDTLLKWLQSSAGTKEAFTGKTTLTDTHLQIAPGGGAQFAEITISNCGTKVVIRTYWS